MDIFEQDHYNYINSEDFINFMKEMFEYEEKEAEEMREIFELNSDSGHKYEVKKI